MDTICLRLNEEKALNGWILTASMSVLFLSAMLGVKAADNIAYSVSPPTVPSIESTKTTIEDIFTQEDREELFDNYIKQKYPGGTITDLAKGVKRIKVVRYFNSRPVKLNIIETDFSLNPDLKLEPAIAGSTLNYKSSIKNLNIRDKAIVSVNGGYFKQDTGAPLGLLMIDGRIYTGEMYNRVAMGIFDDKFEMARAEVNITLKTNNRELKVNNINQPRTLSTNVLIYDNLWGKYSPAAPQKGMLIAIQDGKIISNSTTRLEIPQNGYVISGPKSKIQSLLNDKRIKLEIKTTPEWKNVKHIISGGPYLIKNGEIYIDATEQKLTGITGRNPRTAIGYTSDNNIIIITADGRESASVGLTLGELARYMKQIGCVNAMNLDGGSSTVMYGNGTILNSPAYKGGVAISNAVHIVME